MTIADKVIHFQQEKTNGSPCLISVVAELERACRAHMASNGIPYEGPIEADEKIHRFSIDSKKNQRDEWYVAYENIGKNGYRSLCCVYSSWSSPEVRYNKFTSWSTDKTVGDDDRKELDRAFEKRKKQTEKLLKEEREKTSMECQNIWNSSSEVTSSNADKYLELKGIKNYGCRFGLNQKGYQSQIVPLHNLDGAIRTLQYISVGADGTVYKTFHKGGEKRGSFFIIGNIVNGAPFFVTEGYSTAASIHEATGRPVVVAFDCGNLDPVIKALRNKYSQNEITIAADDDQGTEGNPGKTQAEHAAKKHGCKVILPQFPEGFKLPSGKLPTDFNDLHSHFGLEHVRGVLISNVPSQTQPLDSEETKQELQPVEPSTTIKKIQRVFKPFSFDELIALPPKEYLIDKIVGPGDLGIIYGAPGAGKTFVVIEMIISACAGILFARCFSVKRPLNVVYCAGEGVSGLAARFKTAANHHGIVPKNFTFFPTIPQLFEKSSETIRDFIKEWKQSEEADGPHPIDILIIDTLHTATVSAEENSAKDMGEVLSACRHAAKELGCAVILVHHTNKNATAERGSSALRGAMDFMIEVVKSGKQASIKCSKLKDGEEWKAKLFELKSSGESAYVSWIDSPHGNEEEGAGQKKKDKQALVERMELLNYRVPLKFLALAIEKNDNYTRNLLNELSSEGKCFKELADPTRKSSSANVLQYWVEG